MKRLAIFAVLTAFTFSCGTPKTVVEAKKVIKGYWSLDDISYSESGTFTVQLLNDTSRECFEGSTWRFIPNNNTALYTINNSDCPTGDRHFIFIIQEVDANTGLYEFFLKPTNAKYKSEDNAYFRMQLVQLSGSSMKWEQSVTLEGMPFTISMNFSKIAEK
jgi:Lipocalin-like domain